MAERRGQILGTGPGLLQLQTKPGPANFDRGNTRGGELADDVILKFEELADAQRGAPEFEMLSVQKASGGGVLNPVVERAGDIIHRMSKDVRFGSVAREDVISKIDTVLRALRSGFGFEKEMKQNTRANADFRGITPIQLQEGVDKALKRYANAHSKLPVFNRAQFLAREGAVAIGKKQFKKAERLFSKLSDLTKDPARFNLAATVVKRNASGEIVEFKSDKASKVLKSTQRSSRIPTSGGEALRTARKARILKADPLGLKVRRSGGGKGGGGGFGNILQFDKTTGRFRRAKLLK